MSLVSHIRFSFSRQQASAEAELLWNPAAQTCEALLKLLPLSGESHHAIYSGSECCLILPRVLRLAPENATIKVTPGDVAFAWFTAGSAYGVASDFAEICWFYDFDAEPRMWSGPVPVNVFARIVQPADAFFAVCRSMRREGVKPLVVDIVVPR
jgi:hypothetical protein